MVFITSLLGFFMYQSLFFIRDKCCERHNSVRLGICFDLAIDQSSQRGLNSFLVNYYLAKLFIYPESKYGLQDTQLKC